MASKVQEDVGDKACGQEQDDQAENERKAAEAENAQPNPDGTKKPPLKQPTASEASAAKNASRAACLATIASRDAPPIRT